MVFSLTELCSDLFAQYEALVMQADAAFARMKAEYPALVACKPACADCCHAVFGLFLIEAAYLQMHFAQRDRKQRRLVEKRLGKALQGLEQLQARLKTLGGNAAEASDLMARQRVRCPLLDDSDRCRMYGQRPITCRVYGIPTALKGGIRVCAKTGFKAGLEYPIFPLNEVFRRLHGLSGQMLARLEQGDPAKADLLISLPAALADSPQIVIQKYFGWS